MKNTRLFDRSRDRSRSTSLGSEHLDEAHRASPRDIDDFELSDRLRDTTLALHPHIDNIPGTNYSSPGLSDTHASPTTEGTWTPSFSQPAAGSDLRAWTTDVRHLPLPPESIISKTNAMKNHPQAQKRLAELRDMMKLRKEVALAAMNREVERGAKRDDKEQIGRGASKPDSKLPPTGFRGILQWSDNLPIGPWSKKLNNYIGVLVRRATIVNPYFKFKELPWKAYEDIWRDLMDHFCLEDYPGAWHYVFNIKVEVVLKQWRHEMKVSTYDKYTQDWQRYLNVDERVDIDHFTALLFYWETESAQNKSKKGSTNRLSKRKLDHHLGSTSFANLEYRYCRDTGKPIMPINLKAKLAYGTFRSTYKDDVKIKENMVLVDTIDAASKDAALRATQEAVDDPHVLSREENDSIAMNVMGYNNRGRFPLMGVGASRCTSRKSSTASSASSTVTGSSSRSFATATILRVTRYLRGKIDHTLLMQLTKAMVSDLPPSPTSDDIFTHIVLCLSDKISGELFGEVMDNVDFDTVTQTGLAGGSSSGVQRRDIDDDDDP